MSEESEKEFIPPGNMDQIPKDRVFCIAVLYITEDSQIAGGVDYKGNVLREVGASLRLSAEAYTAQEHLTRYVRKALDHASVETNVLYQLAKAFGITEEDLEQDDNNSIEGSSTTESAAASSVSGNS